MVLRIRRTPYERFGGAHRGPFRVYPDEVFGHVTQIAMAGSPDLPGSLGQEEDGADFFRVTYDPGPQDTSTAPGRVRTLLKELVDQAGNVDIVGVGEGFVWSEGTTLRDSAGGQIGNLVFYDILNCEGDGRWVRGTDGDEVCTTSAGILYHELGHVRLGHPTLDVTADEQAAVGVENDLRTSRGEVPRDPARWFESDCGCDDGDCCIVASVATGSPYSAAVHALRRVRDETLRSTALGAALFDALHTEYYAFSVPVARIAVVDPVARRHVEETLVLPLVDALQLALAVARSPDDVEAVAARLARTTTAAPVGLGWADVASIARAVSAGSRPEPASVAARGDDGVAQVHELLAEWLPKSPHVRWAIVDLVAVYADGRARADAGDPAAAARVRDDLLDWLASLPLLDLAERVPPDRLLADVELLSSSVFASPKVRAGLRARLEEVRR